jgi:site-specific recombinase XerD
VYLDFPLTSSLPSAPSVFAPGHNSVATRNVRLAAIHSFFRYLTTIDPRHLAQSQSILGVQFKRRAHRIPEYLERSEIQSLFVQIDCRTLLGQRDDALLRMLYNTGMSAQELVDLDVNDLRFSRPFSMRIYGKEKKERICPLWKETVDSVRKCRHHADHVLPGIRN